MIAFSPFDEIGVQVLTALSLPDDEAKHLQRLGFKLAEAVETLGLFLEECVHASFTARGFMTRPPTRAPGPPFQKCAPLELGRSKGVPTPRTTSGRDRHGRTY